MVSSLKAGEVVKDLEFQALEVASEEMYPSSKQWHLALMAISPCILTVVALNRVKELICPFAIDVTVGLEEGVQLQKYLNHIPFIASMVTKSIKSWAELI